MSRTKSIRLSWLLFLCSSMTAAQTMEDVARGPSQPNLVLILVDDLRDLELRLGFGRSLEDWDSALERELVDGGSRFPNFFNTTPLCCPSRASYLTGRYSHNHGVLGNNYTLTEGQGGWRRFWELGHHEDHIGVWLQAAGYETVYSGKFLNGYPGKPGDFVPETYVPPGWDRWLGVFVNEDWSPPEGETRFSYTSFRANLDGAVQAFTDGSHLTDVESQFVLNYLDQRPVDAPPFFIVLAHYAPHGPTEPAPRHEGLHAGVQSAPPESFNEEDRSDKPAYVRNIETSVPNHFGNGARRKLDMTLGIDESIASLFSSLEAGGHLDDTYVFFASDNGLFGGEHRLSGKSAPYDEAVKTGFLARGPDIPAGAEFDELVANIDVSATLLELAGADLPAMVDGESFADVWRGLRNGPHWRQTVCTELGLEVDYSSSHGYIVPTYVGVRGRAATHTAYGTGEAEFYDLVLDPAQMQSRHTDAPTGVLAQFEAAGLALSTCVGEACREATRPGWPVAQISYSCVDALCTFDGSSSYSLQGVLSGYEWQISDGTSANGPKLIHEFEEPCCHEVQLVVGDDQGGFGRATVAIDLATLFLDGFEAGLDAWSSSTR